MRALNLKRIKEKLPGKLSKKWLIAGIIAVITLAVVILFFKFSANKINQEPSADNQAQVQRRDIISKITGSAVIMPKDQYTITSLVTGEVLSADFEEGDYVNEGDILYQIDSSDIQSSISSAEIAIKKAQNNYDEAVENIDDLNIRADVEGTIKTLYIKEGDSIQNGGKIADIYDDSIMELTVPFNKSDISKVHIGDSADVYVIGTNDVISGAVTEIKNNSYPKTGNMLVQDVVIQINNPGVISNTDKASASVGVVDCNDVGIFSYITERIITAKTSGEIKKINIKEGNKVSKGTLIAVLESKSIESGVTSNELSLEDAKISREKTLKQLEDYTIKAPISGQVISKNTKVGDKIDTTNKTEEMAIIYDMSSLEFELAIDELDINNVKVGQKVDVTADALDGKNYTGTVSRVSINGTQANGVTTYPVTVTIDNFDSSLLPGMNIDAEIEVSSAKGVLAVPASAIMRGNIVYVAGEKTDSGDRAPEGYRTVTVETGVSDTQFIEIISGLYEGDLVRIVTPASSNEQMPMMPGMGGMGGMGGMSGGMPGNMNGGMPGGANSGMGGNAGGGMPR